MTLRQFTTSVPPAIGAAMEEFEKEFTYPLGSSGRFRIRHGPDYLRFFQAMGESMLLVAENEGRVLGSIMRVKRRIIRSGESVEVIEAHYLCDLKLRGTSRGSRVLARLIRETKIAIEADESTACYCVVMAGTGRLPTDYTGRLGVPEFQRLADITILRLSGGTEESLKSHVVDEHEFESVHSRIVQPGFRAARGKSKLRSAMEPVHLIASGDACGILEDTRLGKRLILESGDELLSAHLSAFKYRNPESAASVLKHAVGLARANSTPAVFVAIPDRELPLLRPFLSGLDVTEAPAVVYGHGFEVGENWWIDTAEI